MAEDYSVDDTATTTTTTQQQSLRPPPRTIRELVSRRAQSAPNHPILGYPDQNNVYNEYTYENLDEYARRAAGHFAGILPVRRSDDEEKVVGLLGAPTLEYLITTLGLSYLGFTVLFLSTRLADQGYVSLLKATGCRHMVVSRNFGGMAKALQDSVAGLEIVPIIEESFHDNASKKGEERVELSEEDLNKETKKVAWIIHSSGSTGPPKPIYQTQHAALRNYDKSMEMEAFVTLPLFHAHGLSSVFRAITCRKKIYLYSGTRPLTSESLLDTLNQHKFEQFLGVPYALKILSETAQGVEALAAMKIVMFGGSACPDALGDYLVDHGVNLVGHYGTTETGQLMTTVRPAGDRAWNYLRMHQELKPYVRWEDRGANLYELVVLDGWPSKVASNRPDGGYATKDLFEPHPLIQGAWKYSARLDDTIILMNGEKAIPIAMEMAVRRNDLVREVVCFGAGKSRLGMMVVVSEAAKDLSPDNIIDQLWSTVEGENKQLPSYAHISREAIRLLPADTSFPQTDKGTVIRQAFYRAFHEQIEQLYDSLESASTGTLVLAEPDLRIWLHTQILQMLPATQVSADDLTENTDLFSLGVDSLQSTQLRSRIMQNVQLHGHNLPPNVVFENPTIAKLAAQVIAVRDGKKSEKVDVEMEMQALIAKYGAFPAHTPRTRGSKVRCVVVTGATGSLGAHIVSQLVQREDIEEVCCLVRASSDKAARERVNRSLADRCVDDLPSESLSKITARASDLADPSLGLSQSDYTSLLTKTTTVIHSAWSVNFNKALTSFEADCIAATKHLLLFCLSAQAPRPATLSFCSSVSAVVNSPNPIIPESLPPTLSSAQKMGYAQSKLVTEHLVDQCAEQTGMAARVLRIGQVVADTRHGVWNANEAIPLMLQSATTIGALPTLVERPRWLPVDIVAKTCVDISLSEDVGSGSNGHGNSGAPLFFNVVNPRTFHWTQDLLPALRTAGVDFRNVGQREWIRLLRQSNPDPTVNPTIKLVEFFAGKYDRPPSAHGLVRNGESAEEHNAVERNAPAIDPSAAELDGDSGPGGPRELTYITQNAETLSSALAHAPILDQECVGKFVGYFQRTSWNRTSNGGGTR